MKGIAAVILLLGTSILASDLTGKWSGTFQAKGAEHSIPQLIVLKQQGATLSGSAGPDAGEQYPIENGRVDHNNARFQVTTGEWKFTYTLTLVNDSLSGNLKLESTTESRTATITLTRVK
ncbi:MAG TPA: hypothetical protein VJQ54_22910 [Candidatus Sulfotelmatobacter sp.]|nr:hypothetical protein [Candidatus Sulfotelmatobacter sp.]